MAVETPLYGVDLWAQSGESLAPVAAPSAPEAPATSPVSEGEIIAEKYRVDKVLGVGGMGVVVAVTHTQLNQKYAIKFLLPHICNDPKIVERFLREAQASVQIRSDHMVRVIDVGKLETGSPFMVMEYLQGNDLSDELKKEGPLPLRDVADYILQACEALAEAHSIGIVHRDLKPSNLFLALRPDRTRQVKVLDFGISKSITNNPDAVALTATAAVMGSPLYMAPEQIRDSKRVDHRADVWALGVTIYELLCGRPPFNGNDMGGLLASIIADRHRDIRQLNPSVPVEIEQLLNRCLTKNRDQRVANIAELTMGLRPFASSVGKLAADRAARISTPATTARGLSDTEAAETLPATMDGPTHQTGFDGAYTQPPVTKRGMAPALGGIALVAAAAVGFFYFQANSEAETAASLAASNVAPPSAPPASAALVEEALREAFFTVEPNDATVTVNQLAVPLSAGRASVRGRPGDSFQVVISKGAQQQVATLVMTSDGSLQPNVVRLPDLDALLKGAAKPSGASMVSRKPTVKPIAPASPATPPSEQKPAAPSTSPKPSGVGPVDSW